MKKCCLSIAVACLIVSSLFAAGEAEGRKLGAQAFTFRSYDFTDRKSDFA